MHKQESQFQLHSTLTLFEIPNTFFEDVYAEYGQRTHTHTIIKINRIQTIRTINTTKIRASET